jgi:hypothetical protein
MSTDAAPKSSHPLSKQLQRNNKRWVAQYAPRARQLSPIDSKCTTYDRIKVYHLGRVVF